MLDQQRTGPVVRQLAAWAAILAVPTAIAGIYGMNFPHTPEQGMALWLRRLPDDHLPAVRPAVPQLQEV